MSDLYPVQLDIIPAGVVRDHLSVLGRGVNKFKNFWFSRDARKTNDWIIRFDVDLMLLLNAFMSTELFTRREIVIGVTRYYINVKSNGEDKKRGLEALPRIMSTWTVSDLMKVLRLPVQASEDMISAREHALEAWVWLQEHYKEFL